MFTLSKRTFLLIFKVTMEKKVKLKKFIRQIVSLRLGIIFDKNLFLFLKN